MASAIPAADALRRGPFESGPITKELGPIESGERDARYDNEPPLEERVVMDFLEDLQKHGEHGEKSISARIDELLASAARAPAEIIDQDINGEPKTAATIAGGMGDLCKQARDVASRLEAAREKHNRPLLNSQRALKSRADELIAPLQRAIMAIRAKLDKFASDEADRQRKEEEARREAARIAEEAARAALEEQGMADQIPDVVIEPAPQPRVAAPMARGDLGARVGGTTSYAHKITSVRKLPDRLLKHPKVIEALDKIIAAEIKSASGKCKIPGVEFWPVTRAAIR